MDRFFSSSFFKDRLPYFCFVLFCSLLVLFSRRPDAFLHPQFWAEDGHYWFADAYNHGFWHTIFWPQDGYLQTFSRLVGGVATLFPLKFAPAIYLLFAVAAQLLPVILLASERMAHLIPSRNVRLVLAFLYLAMPNSREVHLNVTNSQWRLALVVFMIACASVPKHRWGKILDYLLVAVSSISGPFVVFLTPILGIIAFSKRRIPHYRNLFIIAACAAAIQAASLLFLTVRVTKHYDLGANIGRLIKIVGLQIGGGTLFGADSVLKFFYFFPVQLALFCFVSLVLVLGIIKGRLELKLFNLLVILMFSAALIAPGLDGSPKWEVMTFMGSANRYFFFPILAVLVNLVWLATSRRAYVRELGLIPLALVVFVAIPLDWRYAPFVNLHYSQEVKKFEQLPRGTTYAIPENPGWAMDLTKK